MPGTTVSRIDIWTMVWYFIIYLATHIALAMMEKTYSFKNHDKTNPEVLKISRALNLAVKWWPAIYLVFVIILLYTS